MSDFNPDEWGARIAGAARSQSENIIVPPDALAAAWLLKRWSTEHNVPPGWSIAGIGIAAPVVSTCDDYPECERDRDRLTRERDEALAMLRECRDALRYWTNHEYWSATDEDTIARINALLARREG